MYEYFSYAIVVNFRPRQTEVHIALGAFSQAFSF